MRPRGRTRKRLHRVFEPSGASSARCVLEQHLVVARAGLASAAVIDGTVAEVACTPGMVRPAVVEGDGRRPAAGW